MAVYWLLKERYARKNVVEEEDRSTNVMIFGMRETKNEDVETNVSDLFNAIGVKPYVLECIRIGKKAVDDPSRPVRKPPVKF